MPAPTTTGGGSMGYPATVDSGGVPSLIISTDIVSLQGLATNTLVGNTVYLFAFELYAATTFSGAKWRVGATATGTSDIGIYDIATGTKQASIGATTNTASTTMSQALSSGNITLSPGQYFLAYCVSNSTDTIFSESLGNLAVLSHYRQANNTATAGVLPSTLGGYTDVPAKVPAVSLTVVNGLT